ncbi:MAG: hypothetical protein ABEJ87_05690 [Candidatus Nanohalobium sp.]
MKHLVAGKGFIGTALGERLEGEVKYLDRSSGDIKQDITREFNLEEKFDTVYNTVGLAPGFATEKQYRKVHVEGTRNLLNAVNTEKFVQVSALRCEVDHPFFNTKKEAEQLVKDSGLEHTVIRPSTVIGRGNKLLELMKKASITRVFPRTPAKMQPVTVENLVDCLVKVQDTRNGETLNIAGPEKMTVTEMAEKIYREEGRNCTLLPIPPEFFEDMLKTLGTVNRPPLTKQNWKLIKADNTTDTNHAPQLTQLEKAF